MQQRPISSSRAPVDHCLINLTEESSPEQAAATHSPRAGRAGHLPAYSCPSSSGLHRKSTGKHSRSASTMCIRAVAVIALLSLFTIWWFSYPVDLEYKDGRFVEVRPLKMALPLNRNHVELAVLASSSTTTTTLPILPAPHAQKTQNLTSSSESEAHLTSELINDAV